MVRFHILRSFRQGTTVLGKKVVQTGANVAQDVLAGENFNISVASVVDKQLVLAGAGRKATKRKVQFQVRLDPRNTKQLHIDKDKIQ